MLIAKEFSPPVVQPDRIRPVSFHIPVFSIACSGNNEGHYAEKELYDQIPVNLAVKAKSEGITDNSCNTHCGKTGQMKCTKNGELAAVTRLPIIRDKIVFYC